MAVLDDLEIRLLEMLSSGLSDRDAYTRLNLDERTLNVLWEQIGEKLQTLEPVTVSDYELILSYERIERRRLEREVWANEARLNALIDTAPEAVFVINGHTGRILKCNNRALTMFGYAPRELIGHEMEILVSPEIRTVHVAYRKGFLNSVRKREMGYHPPIEALRKDGSTIVLDIALTATQATDDVMVVCRPVTADSASSPLFQSSESA